LRYRVARVPAIQLEKLVVEAIRAEAGPDTVLVRPQYKPLLESGWAPSTEMFNSRPVGMVLTISEIERWAYGLVITISGPPVVARLGCTALRISARRGNTP
jgi:hypothetical protein